LGLHRPRLLEGLQVTGDLGLLKIEDFSQVADAKGALLKQVHDPQARPGTEAFVDPDIIHIIEYSIYRI